MNKVLIILDKKINSQDELFLIISEHLEEKKLIKENTSARVVKAFQKRESESSTAFEDGFAIPHAVSKDILKPTTLYIRLKNEIDCNSLDGKKSKYFVCLFIPEKDRQSEHMNILSAIATGLLKEEFKNILKTSKNNKEIQIAFDDIINSKSKKESKIDNVIKSDQKTMKILAITACPVGVAHTYLAAERIQLAAEDSNYSCKVETHGSVGIKNEFKKSEIEEADLIIIASDIGIDTTRFAGKKIYKTTIKPAISGAKKLIVDAINNAKVESVGVASSDEANDSKEKKSIVVKHLLSGVSYMIPFIIFGGLLLALSLGIGKAIYSSGNIPDGTFLWYLQKFGEAAFSLMIPILGGFIANSIAGRAAIAPAMIVSFIANTSYLIYQLPGMSEQTPLGFIGAILFGVTIGWTVKWMNTWKISKNLSSLMPIFIIPLAVTLLFSLLSVFIISAPISFVMSEFGKAISSVFVSSSASNIGVQIGVGIGMGLLIGAMAGFDMGGPINKIAFITCSTLLTVQVTLPDGTLQTGIGNPMGMMAAAIPVAPLSMGLSTMIYKKNFSAEQKSLGVSAIVMGFIGISEGAIPFAISDPKRVIVANIVGSSVAGAIAGALGVTCGVAHGGPIVGMLGAVSGSFIGVASSGLALGLGILFFFIAIAIGTLVTVVVYGLLLKYVKNANENTEKVGLSGFTLFKQRVISGHQNNIVKLNQNKSYLWAKNNKKLTAWIVLATLSSILLVLGISLISVSLANHELQDFINNVNNLPDETFKFPIMSAYAIFTLLSSLIMILGTVFYWFTAFDKNKVNVKLKNSN